jgi:hypothetical protein
MILNNAANIMRGTIQTNYVYHGDILIWPPGKRPIDPDKYEEDYSDYIVIVLLDSFGDETDVIYYASTLDEALRCLAILYDNDPYALYNVYYGNRAATPSTEEKWNKSFIDNIYPSGANKNNIKMFRYPRVFRHDSIWALSNIHTSVSEPGQNYATRLRTIIMPESVPNYTEFVNWAYDLAAYSGVEEVIFRGKRPWHFHDNAFENCMNLREIEFYSYRVMSKKTFKGCKNITIKLHNAPNSVSNEPWGAEAPYFVMWLGED